MHSAASRNKSLLAIYFRPQWIKIILLACALLLEIALQISGPKLIQYFIDVWSSGDNIPLLATISFGYIAIALLNEAVTVVTSYLGNTIAWTATNQLRTDLFFHCLSLDQSFHKSRTPGELIERIDSDVDALSNLLSNFVLELLTNALLLASILGIYFLMYWLLGLVMTLFVVALMTILWYLRHIAIPRWRSMREQRAQFFGFLSEHLAGTEDIRSNGARPYVMYLFYRFIRRWFPLYRRAMLINVDTGIIMVFLSVCGSALSLALGAFLWSRGILSLGSIFAIYRYTDMLNLPINRIQEHIQDLQQAEACLKRIEDLKRITSALPEGRGTPLPAGSLAVKYQQVTFAYTQNTPVLHQVSFQLAAGKVLGVLGRTGSGKTTLAHLLLRLYDPQEGEIYVGGIPVQDPFLQDLRRHVGMITQNIQLLHASIRDNLTFFNASISDQRLLEIIEEVGLSAWYKTLPDGLDTILGTEGGGLSAGEAQQLAFARIFLHDPGLIILDEASSLLDSVTEYYLERTLDKLLTGRTAIIIAHRLSTIQRADEILILDQGRIVEYGERKRLASRQTSYFSQLLQLI